LKISAFARQLFWLILLFIIAVSNFAAYVVAEKRIDRANELRLQAVLLANELRQSSDDLTRMVRTYVVTGKPIYKAHYQEILDIRNGVVARPEGYQGVYWDLVLDDDVRPTARSQVKKSLLELMREAGFTSAEFALLAAAKANSDALVSTELTAMRLSENTDADAEALWQQARLLVHGAKYHHAKATIMLPIAEFERLAEQRNDAAVSHAVNVALLFRLVMVLLIVALMVALWRTYQALRQTLGSSVQVVKNKIDKIAQGDFDKTISLNLSRPNNNVLGWLSEMQGKLQESQVQQARLTENLQNEKERAQVTLACIGDAVITTDAKGRVTFLNQVAIDLTACSLAEALHKPLNEIFNIVNEASRQPVANPVQQVLQEGKTVLLANHTVLLARDGKEYNIEDSAAPIYLPSGELLGCVLVFHDVTEKHRLLRDVRWQAGHDVLTGLPNRALLADRFERALAHAKRQQQNLAVCLLDLDQFKPVNDTYGHDVGDQLLVAAAQRLTAAVRAEDTVARLGGDEFVLLLGGLHSTAEKRASLQRILAAMAEPYLIAEQSIEVPASIGVVMYPEDEVDADTLMRHADQAMYQAKQSGRNRYHLFDVHHDLETQTRQQTVARIKQALHQEELCVYYQPKVNMRSGELVGMEALLRWIHPEQGVLAPGGFLPAIEQTDLIIDIGEWVLEQAMRQLLYLLQNGVSCSISVNVAARQFQQPDFVAKLTALLARHPDVPAHLLELEILESVAQRDISQVRHVIVQAQKLGVSFALDDFGTGYSSLSYLKQLPADTLKIDQSFVRDMLEDEEDLALVKAIIGLAKVFDRKVVAEGVETSEHGILLMHLGCDVAQGYGIARPMPGNKVLAWQADFVRDKHWQIWGNAAWELADLPLLMAARDHTLWVANVLRSVSDEHFILPRKKLGNCHQCRFGKWYDSIGKDYFGELEAFQAIAPLHQQVHTLGHQILQQRDAGDLEQARANCVILQGLKEQLLAQLERLQAGAINIAR
ncbi:MAG: EAL domain-containing protein, partial [Gallionella sp.]